MIRRKGGAKRHSGGEEASRTNQAKEAEAERLGEPWAREQAHPLMKMHISKRAGI